MASNVYETGAGLSIKENIEVVKEQLNQEEKFFEQAVRTERFVKKYKTPLVVTVSAIIVIIAGLAIYNVLEENKIEKANVAFNILSKNPTDQAAANDLKSLAPALYDAWTLSTGSKSKAIDVLEKLTNSQATAVADIAIYQLAALKKDAVALASYTYMQDAIYKDIAVIEEAVLLIESEKIDEAHQKLGTISEESPAYKISRLLLHYGVK